MKRAREMACSTPERTRLDHCFGRGILGRERLPSIGSLRQGILDLPVGGKDKSLRGVNLAPQVAAFTFGRVEDGRGGRRSEESL